MRTTCIAIALALVPAARAQRLPEWDTRVGRGPARLHATLDAENLSVSARQGSRVSIGGAAGGARRSRRVVTRIQTPRIEAAATGLDVANVVALNPTIGPRRPSMLLIRNRARTVADADGLTPSGRGLYRHVSDGDVRGSLRSARRGGDAVEIGNVYLDERRHRHVREIYNILNVRRGIRVRR